MQKAQSTHEFIVGSFDHMLSIFYADVWVLPHQVAEQFKPSRQRFTETKKKQNAVVFSGLSEDEEPQGEDDIGGRGSDEEQEAEDDINIWGAALGVCTRLLDEAGDEDGDSDDAKP